MNFSSGWFLFVREVYDMIEQICFKPAFGIPEFDRIFMVIIIIGVTNKNNFTRKYVVGSVW